MVMTRPLTVQDFERMGPGADDFELVDGVLRERGIMDGRHGEYGSQIHGTLFVYNSQAAIGRLYTSDTGFIWLVQPSPKAVTIYAAGQEPRTVEEDGELDGGDVLPGFRLAVGEIFR